MKYEDLTHILDEEKKTALSRIAPDFYIKVNEYVKELENADLKISRRHSEQAILIQYEIKNALSTIDKIFKKRTLKIIKMASARAFSRTRENVSHDVENMTSQEQEVYQQVLSAIILYKDASIGQVLGNDEEKKLDVDPLPPEEKVTAPNEDIDTQITGEETHSSTPDDDAPTPTPTPTPEPEPESDDVKNVASPVPAKDGPVPEEEVGTFEPTEPTEPIVSDQIPPVG
ncbi:MAG: DNA replication complex GINS family protein, partial [ANME-2 cluster archaeon]|nr:DNA replication complex GINS family protein [ANME-2 cluster archaeon]